MPSKLLSGGHGLNPAVEGEPPERRNESPPITVSVAFGCGAAMPWFVPHYLFEKLQFHVENGIERGAGEDWTMCEGEIGGG